MPKRPHINIITMQTSANKRQKIKHITAKFFFVNQCIDCASLLLWFIVSCRIGVSDAGFRLCILFFMTSQSVYRENYY